MTAAERVRAVRQGDGRVTTVELFFDLVYVFAVTQLSHSLVEHPSAEGAVRAAILLALVWQVWVYTTWMVNYLHPDHGYVRALLLATMLASLLIASAIPEAFHDTGAVLAVTWAVVHVGQPLLVVLGVRDRAIRMIYLRIGPWCVLSSALVVIGGVAHGHHLREILWVLAIVVDLVGAAVGFWVPGLGRSSTRDWTISGSHFAERCQGFASVERIEASPDPGRVARTAFHYVHPVIIAGIIVSAAADERVLEHPTADVHGELGWFVLGGTALFLAGHAVFKALVRRTASWPRIVAVVVLLALLPVASAFTAVVLSLVTLAVVILVAVADRLMLRRTGA